MLAPLRRLPHVPGAFFSCAVAALELLCCILPHPVAAEAYI